MLKPLRILVGCEKSGVVRRALAARGHDVTSCDLQPSEDGSNHHIICDIRNLPKLTPTNRLQPPAKGTQAHRDWSRVHRMSPSPERSNLRSRTYAGLAEAMADQWVPDLRSQMEEAA